MFVTPGCLARPCSAQTTQGFSNISSGESRWRGLLAAKGQGNALLPVGEFHVSPAENALKWNPFRVLTLGFKV